MDCTGSAPRRVASARINPRRRGVPLWYAAPLALYEGLWGYIGAAAGSQGWCIRDVRTRNAYPAHLPYENIIYLFIYSLYSLDHDLPNPHLIWANNHIKINSTYSNNYLKNYLGAGKIIYISLGRVAYIICEYFNFYKHLRRLAHPTGSYERAHTWMFRTPITLNTRRLE